LDDVENEGISRLFMKLSEAILLGSTMLAAKPGAQYFSETKSGCALGMAAIAVGCRFQRGPRRAINEHERRTLGAEGVWGQWVLCEVMRPCDCSFFRAPRKMRIKDIIAHVFDFHVMKKKNWTLEQLAAWIETWEPREIARPFANALPHGKPILVGPRIDQHQAEQEWQRVRQAFEARHKTRRSSRGSDRDKNTLS
jgi:hypothetical protein